VLVKQGRAEAEGGAGTEGEDEKTVRSGGSGFPVRDDLVFPENIGEGVGGLFEKGFAHGKNRSALGEGEFSGRFVDDHGEKMGGLFRWPLEKRIIQGHFIGIVLHGYDMSAPRQEKEKENTQDRRMSASPSLS